MEIRNGLYEIFPAQKSFALNPDYYEKCAKDKDKFGDGKIFDYYAKKTANQFKNVVENHLSTQLLFILVAELKGYCNINFEKLLNTNDPNENLSVKTVKIMNLLKKQHPFLEPEWEEKVQQAKKEEEKKQNKNKSQSM